jgi:hypothetical protein
MCQQQQCQMLLSNILTYWLLLTQHGAEEEGTHEDGEPVAALTPHKKAASKIQFARLSIAAYKRSFQPLDGERRHAT